MHIKTDDLSSPEIAALLKEHMEDMARHSPPESVHALDLESLKEPEMTFFTAWEGLALLGCAAIKELNAEHAEIKSMRTSSKHLRKGVAASLLAHVLDEARRHSYQRISLETGSMDALTAAKNLYANFGFRPCEPFADYIRDPHSIFMTMEL